ncbi:helix-turn-helix domain-containing protein [Endozoicomonadaceae bacterium StTr2]
MAHFLPGSRQPEKLVENRISFHGSNSALSIYDTWQPETNVTFESDVLLHCSMVSGQKMLHCSGSSQPFLPGESFILAPENEVTIDFPQAAMDNPTTCLALEIDRQCVTKVANRLYDKDILTEEALSDFCFYHLQHTTDTQQLIERIWQTYLQDNPDRTILIELGITELLVRLMRDESRHMLLDYSRRVPDANGFNAVLHAIDRHPEQPLDMDTLCTIACMSRSRLYSEFQRKLGVSPAEYQKQQRMKKSLEMLKQGRSVTQTCFDLGFQNLSHFSRLFRQFYGASPRNYLKQHA